MKHFQFPFVWFLALLPFLACNNNATTADKDSTTKEVNVYTHRHYDTDKQLFKDFETKTGIKVNVVKANADELINRLETEGTSSPADILISVDAGRLHRAKTKGLLQGISSETINKNIPENFRDKDGQWFALTRRARILAYSPERVKVEELSTYEDLADPKWKGRLLVRSSGNIYNQSLLASIIANEGEEKATEWAKGIVANLARAPKGNDRDQVKAIAQGTGDLAIVNSYYIGKMLNSDNAEEKKAGEMVKIFFPDSESRGTHINVSAIGVAKHAPNKENAIKLIEFLSDKKAQSAFAESNYEYPVNPEIKASTLLQSWGEFSADPLPLEKLGELNGKAVQIFDETGWK